MDRFSLVADKQGEYVVGERREDGRVVLRPGTSVEAIRRRVGTRPMTDAEFAVHFGDLPRDGEGELVADSPRFAVRFDAEAFSRTPPRLADESAFTSARDSNGTGSRGRSWWPARRRVTARGCRGA